MGTIEGTIGQNTLTLLTEVYCLFKILRNYTGIFRGVWAEKSFLICDFIIGLVTLIWMKEGHYSLIEERYQINVIWDYQYCTVV